MGLKIQLIKNGKVVLDLPLSIEEWRPEIFQRELQNLEEDIHRIQTLHDVLSNETRIRMLCKLVRTLDCRFSELMADLGTNQKIISDGLRRMTKMYLVRRVEKHPRDVHYNPSPLGFASLATCLIMRRILDEIEQSMR
ncbi:ArsR family transcriptional regulator [Candidatus Bathyarchaeota archaeon]|nr:ArsR family transcriptional regulator [Candidatus Bathyarchaeota archaeon]